MLGDTCSLRTEVKRHVANADDIWGLALGSSFQVNSQHKLDDFKPIQTKIQGRLSGRRSLRFKWVCIAGRELSKVRAIKSNGPSSITSLRMRVRCRALSEFVSRVFGAHWIDPHCHDSVYYVLPL